ncbi:MAG: DDE-type integrase/transposase/recombinase [Chloroflexota bacterium]|nr:DDE-type integrase/transposase/recombinase [Chloroflexota bacterium]
MTSTNLPVKAPYFEVACKYCGSRNVIRYGSFRGTQRFFCNDCHRKFADNDALPDMQTPVEQVGAAVGMYYRGQSLNNIRESLAEIYGIHPSDSTVYRWVVRFTKKALAEAKGYTPKVGDVWVADETALRIDGGWLWFWDIIDSDTRYLLASHVSRTRTAKDAQTLMEAAAARAGKTPNVVLTDGLLAYLDGIELAFGRDTRHITQQAIQGFA